MRKINTSYNGTMDTKRFRKGGILMPKKHKEPYGYPVDDGYMGYVAVYNKMMKFATEGEYREYIS